MATTTVLRSAARRLSCSAASSIITREVTGYHNLTIDGYKATSRKLSGRWSAASQTFEAAGYNWRVTYQPNNNSWSEYIDLYLEHVHDDHHGPDSADRRLRADDPVEIKLSLLDKAGNPSGYLKDDRFTVRFEITVIKSWTESTAAGSINNNGTIRSVSLARGIVVPPSDLHEHLNNLLWKKQGTDVTVDVGGEAFEAHMWLLAARSPVFETELLAAAKEMVPSGGIRPHMKIQDMEPRVFKAMLHFMYTDSLPAMEEEEAMAMTHGLVAAAHRYKMERMMLDSNLPHASI
ncbi:hypothetical protein PR202_gb23492 [Eleusine coracana subsp. coracana]|uniref:BTB domain-containing protein n=1 Tax=Eleusine coracana subsp. coracana TaxID=191504 RepID=A0AAV5FID8_ELECO|nr:hypothetical protein PR202_gb23492 [Eleusine coracana subsp. coracana]